MLSGGKVVVFLTDLLLVLLILYSKGGWGTLTVSHIFVLRYFYQCCIIMLRRQALSLFQALHGKIPPPTHIFRVNILDLATPAPTPRLAPLSRWRKGNNRIYGNRIIPFCLLICLKHLRTSGAVSNLNYMLLNLLSSHVRTVFRTTV